MAFGDFRKAFPEGKVFSRDTRLPQMERVVGLDIGGEAKAYPFDVLETDLVINDELGGAAVVVFWKPATKSALDETPLSIGLGR